jgi:prevent-host-death family protein
MESPGGGAVRPSEPFMTGSQAIPFDKLRRRLYNFPWRSVMIDVTRTVTMEQAQKGLKRIIEDVQENRTPYVLTRFGKPQALIVGIEEYEEMQEELALLSNSEHITRIAEARAAYKASESIPFEDYIKNRRDE